MQASLPLTANTSRFKLLIIGLIVLNLIAISLYLATGSVLFVFLCPLLWLGLFIPLMMRAAQARSLVTFFAITSLLLVIGLFLAPGFPIRVARITEVSLAYVTGALMVSLAGIGVLLTLIEFGVLRLLSLVRVGAIARITYYEALLQPFTIIILASGVLAMGVMARVSFFTYYEDFKMYRDVASSFVFLFSLPIMVFASSKVIDEEIENRTMLTLMSKPISRLQVVLGKYLGVLLLMLAAVGTLGIMATAFCYLRYYDDMLMDYRVASSLNSVNALDFGNYKSFMAILPSLMLSFFQVAALAAISVAISTRFGLATNVTIIVIIYIAANLAQYMSASADLPIVVRVLVNVGRFVLPGLTLLDLNQRLVFGQYLLGKDEWMADTPTIGVIWQYVGISAIYTLFYISAALSFGVALFRSRELS